MPQYHLQLDPGDIGEYVLMPGDPGRVELIARCLQKPRHVASNREYVTYTGELDGVAVSVTSHGIGGPSTAIAVEELCNVGAKTLIRVGSCGTLTTDLRFGDVAIAQGAVRNEGTTRAYAPVEFPAIADVDVVLALREAAKSAGHNFVVGTVATGDGFYPAEESGRMPLAEEINAKALAYQRCGVIASEMETATVLVVAAIRKVRAGSVLGVINTSGDNAMPDAHDLPLQAAIDTAIGGVRGLIAASR